LFGSEEKPGSQIQSPISSTEEPVIDPVLMSLDDVSTVSSNDPEVFSADFSVDDPTLLPTVQSGIFPNIHRTRSTQNQNIEGNHDPFGPLPDLSDLLDPW